MKVAPLTAEMVSEAGRLTSGTKVSLLGACDGLEA